MKTIARSTCTLNKSSWSVFWNLSVRFNFIYLPEAVQVHRQAQSSAYLSQAKGRFEFLCIKLILFLSCSNFILPCTHSWKRNWGDLVPSYNAIFCAISICRENHGIGSLKPAPGRIFFTCYNKRRTLYYTWCCSLKLVICLFRDKLRTYCDLNRSPPPGLNWRERLRGS